MKFMVEFRLKRGSKNKAVEAFEQRGPNRIPGVTFRQAWIGASTDVVFVLVESSDESLVGKVAQSWSAHGQSQIYRVIDAEQF